MLKTLTVWNFALLEYAQVEFDHGLNILTGETGAGKSILIDALGAILGQRVGASSIRTGCDWLRVEAVFCIENEEAREFLADHTIETEDDLLIITRQVTKSGRGTILVNGIHVTVAVLKQIGAYLIDIHGQNENLALLKESSQYDLLDKSDAAIEAALFVYRESFSSWTEAERALEEKKQSSRDYEQRLDLLKWQEKEISDADLKEDEYDKLEGEIQRLAHVEKITSASEGAYQLLHTDSRGGLSVLSALAQVKKYLSDIERYDDSLSEASKSLEEAYTSLQEISYDIRDYAENLEYNPAILDKMQSRLDQIDKLRKKYGATIPDILDHLEKVKAELGGIEHYDEDIARMEEELNERKKALEGAAKKLTEARRLGAEKLSEEIGAQILALGMPKAKFLVEISPAETYSARGADRLAMLFSANPGEEAKSLQEVASGGELSRIALAIKTVSARQDTAFGSMVFDEIDTGIGGKTAQMVAERIAQVAKFKQVLCITHLPQIACMADSHLYISKQTQGEKTVTSVERLSETEQVREIARMASGTELTAASLDNAREMLFFARVKKQSV